MEFLNSKYRECMTSIPAFSEAIDQMRSEIDSFMTEFSDDPTALSGWGHRYFCNDDGGRLIFDVHKPHEHVCSVCGKVYTGHVYDETWVYFYRNLAILTALKAAAVYRAGGDRKYRKYALDIIAFYAGRYKEFPLHDKEGNTYSDIATMKWGCGRILPQGLNESIIAIRIIQALELLKDELPEGYKQMIHDSMFEEFYEVIKPQVDSVHNIRVWNLAALGASALFFCDDDILKFVFEGEYNIHRQLSEGVTPDMFWYEGSIHYNFFLLEGMMTFLVFCHVYGKDFGEDEKILFQMLENAYMYAFSNDRFPDPNDGWPELNLKTYSYIYHMGAKCWEESSTIGNIVKLIETDGTKRTSLPLSESYYSKNGLSLEWLLFNPDFDMESRTTIRRSSYDYPVSNFAMLRLGKLEAFIKYGLNGPSHAHPDIMNIEVAHGPDMISRDLSNAGYYSRMCIEWHRMTASHNTVVVGGENIPSTEPGHPIAFSADSITVENCGVYPGVDYKRSLSISGDTLIDEFSVFSENNEAKDYFFHLEAGFHPRLEGFSTEPSSLGFSGNGYEFFSDVDKVICPNGDGSVVTVTAIGSGRSITLHFRLERDMELFIAKSMDNPVTRYRTAFVVRSFAANPIFNTSITID